MLLFVKREFIRTMEQLTIREIRRYVLVLFVGGLLVRLLYLSEAVQSPYFAAPFLDELYHYLHADEIARGKLVNDEVFFRAPLYVYLLGLKFATFGRDFFTTRLLQHFIGATTVSLVFIASFLLFGGRIVRDEQETRAGSAPREMPSPALVPALFAAVIYMFYAPAVFFEGEMLDIFLSCFWCALLMTALFSFSWWSKHHAGYLLAGILIGLTAITRPNVLIFLPFILIYIIYYICTRKTRFGNLVLNILLLLVGIIMPVLPVTIHNAVIGDCFVPISSYDGINFYIGNNSTADGYTSKTPYRYVVQGEYEDSVELFAKKEAALLMGYKPTAAEVRSYWYRRAWREIISSPHRFWRLLAKKFVLFWNAYEIKNNKNLYIVSEFCPLWGFLFKIFNFGTIAPLALAGLLISIFQLKTRRLQVSLLLAIIVSYCFSVIMFFVSGRYRLPVIVLLVPFAGYCISYLIHGVQRLNVQKIVLCTALLVIFGILVNMDWYGIRKGYNPAKDYWSIANCYRQKGAFDDALLYYTKSIDSDPSFTDGYNNLGETLFALERYDEAADAFKRTIQIEPDYIKGYNNLGVYYEQMHDWDTARDMYKRAIRIEPSYAHAHFNLAELLYRQGDIAGALYRYRWSKQLGIDRRSESLERLLHERR